MSQGEPRIWVLLGHRRGDNNQLLALAHALHLPFETRSLRYNLLRKVPKQVLGRQLVSVLPETRKWLEPPWPDLVLGIGHRSVPVARRIRIASGGRTKLVQLGNPRVHPRNFDLVITTPQYGVQEYRNVVRLPLAMDSPHAPNVLTDDERAFLDALPRPHRLLVLGGPNKHWFVAPDDVAAVLGNGYRLGEIAAEVVPNGFWPLDFGGALGEPVTRGIAAKLPWLNGPDNPAATALRSAGLPGIEAIDAKEAFTRK